MIKYPVRCRIVDIAGEVIDPEYPNVVAMTPDASKPHIGEEGLAEEIFGLEADIFNIGLIRITLDNGNIIWGHECWWTPIE